MKKFSFLFLVLSAVMVMSCSEDDPVEEIIDIEEPFTVGVLAQTGVDYFLIDKNEPFNSPSGLSTIEIDLNEDNVADISFELDNSLEDLDESLGDQAQLLMVKALGDTELAWSNSTFKIFDIEPNFIELSSMDEELTRDSFQWTKSQKLLLAFRQRSSFMSAGPSALGNTAYIPVIVDDRIGWVEFSIVLERGIVVEGLEFKWVAFDRMDDD